METKKEKIDMTAEKGTLEYKLTLAALLERYGKGGLKPK